MPSKPVYLRGDRQHLGKLSELASFFLSYLSRSLADRWGATVDFTTSFLHSPPLASLRVRNYAKLLTSPAKTSHASLNES